MPTWGQLLPELAALQIEAQKLGQDRIKRGLPPVKPGDASPFDVLRRKYLKELSEHTGRAVIVYASAWMDKAGVSADALSINLGDIRGLMEAASNTKERELDLILHSPGGQAEAAESMVEYLRTQFDHIRVFVPVAAMSAATMVALSADEIVMGAHSQLGPIDPQFTLFTPEGPRTSPGQAILDQFDLAKDDCATNPGHLAAWLPVLRSYLPGLIAQCRHARELSEQYVENWLTRFMFDKDPDGADKAKKAAAWFADFTYFRSHGRRVSREDARGLDLNVTDLEDDQALQDKVLTAHHGVQLTLGGTPTLKIIENHHGRAWVNQAQEIQVQVQGPPPPPGS